MSDLIDRDALLAIVAKYDVDDKDCSESENSIYRAGVVDVRWEIRNAPTVSCAECASCDNCYIACMAQRLDGWPKRGVVCADFERRQEKHTCCGREGMEPLPNAESSEWQCDCWCHFERRQPEEPPFNWRCPRCGSWHNQSEPHCPCELEQP